MNYKQLIKYTLFALALFMAGIFLPKAYSNGDQVYRQLKVLMEVISLVQDKYVEQTDSKDLIYGAAKGVVGELDDFSQFMTPEMVERLQTETKGEFGGLGIRITTEDGYITVITPMLNSPALEAGILPGDKIIKIEGEDVRNLSSEDAVKRLRGKPGTKVKITILRINEEDGKKEPVTKDYEIKRANIVPEVSLVRLLEDNIGYIHLMDFSGHSLEEVNKYLVQLKDNGMKALVLDLRYNPGGLLMSAVEISKLFLDNNKMIVYTKGRTAETYQEFRSALTAPYADLPLVVLVNGASASGSEIVAGAIQDNKRGILIGERTFGKASVQSVLPLSDSSALRLTVAKYYTPSGNSIQRNHKEGTGGITPDIEVKSGVEVIRQLVKQYDKIYVPEKKDEKSGKKKDNVKKNSLPEEKVENDDALLRAVEILKAREALSNLAHPDIK